jgi:hypothetical protein
MKITIDTKNLSKISSKFAYAVGRWDPDYNGIEVLVEDEGAFPATKEGLADAVEAADNCGHTDACVVLLVPIKITGGLRDVNEDDLK